MCWSLYIIPSIYLSALKHNKNCNVENSKRNIFKIRIGIFSKDQLFDFILQMQSTIREHRDGGNAGGIFNRYNVIRVSFNFQGENQIASLASKSNINGL